MINLDKDFIIINSPYEKYIFEGGLFFKVLKEDDTGYLVVDYETCHLYHYDHCGNLKGGLKFENYQLLKGFIRKNKLLEI